MRIVCLLFIKDGMRDVSFKYRSSDSYVIKNFNLDVKKGEIVSIVGLSGSGKSTVLRLLAGLEMPYNGSIAISNKIVANDTTFVQPERRNIGMVFQGYDLFPHLTVSQNVAFGISNLSNKYRSNRTSELLRLINMKEYQERYPHQLSGGQQQRVAVARALAPNPHLLLMDEPFSNIDYGLKEKMRQEIRSILKAESVTSIFVTHDSTDVEDMADRVVQL